MLNGGLGSLKKWTEDEDIGLTRQLCLVRPTQAQLVLALAQLKLASLNVCVCVLSVGSVFRSSSVLNAGQYVHSKHTAGQFVLLCGPLALTGIAHQSLHRPLTASVN